MSMKLSFILSLCFSQFPVTPIKTPIEYPQLISQLGVLNSNQYLLRLTDDNVTAFGNLLTDIKTGMCSCPDSSVCHPITVETLLAHAKDGKRLGNQHISTNLRNATSDMSLIKPLIENAKTGMTRKQIIDVSKMLGASRHKKIAHQTAQDTAALLAEEFPHEKGFFERHRTTIMTSLAGLTAAVAAATYQYPTIIKMVAQAKSIVLQ